MKEHRISLCLLMLIGGVPLAFGASAGYRVALPVEAFGGGSAVLHADDLVVISVPDIGVLAYNATTGGEEWRTEAKVGPLVVSDSEVFIGGTTRGDLVGVARSNGSVLWNLSISPDPEGVRAIVLHGANVYGSKGNTVFAVNATKTLWMTSFEERPGPLAVIEGFVVVPLVDEVVGLDLLSGHEAWRTAIPQGPFAGPVSIGDGAIVRTKSALLAINPTGAIRWSADHPTESAPILPSYANGTIYATADTRVLAVEASTGRLKWETEVDDWPSTPVASGDRVVVNGQFGSLSVLEDSKGVLRGRTTLALLTVGSPMLVGDDAILIVMTLDPSSEEGTSANRAHLVRTSLPEEDDFSAEPNRPVIGFAGFAAVSIAVGAAVIIMRRGR